MATNETDAGVDIISKRPSKETELRYRINVDDSGTKATLASITASRANDVVDGGSLVFATDAIGGDVAPRMVIDPQGSVGIGLMEPKARLHVDGDVLFSGPLTISGALSGQNLSLTGSGEIRGALVVGGDVTVTGKVKASSFAGDGAELTNIGPKNDSIGSAQLVSDLGSLGKLSGGKVVIKNDRVGVGVESPDGDCIFDVGARMKVRQGSSASAGIWFAQTGVDHSAFVGMADNDRIGFWGGGAGWGLTMNKDDGSVALTGALSTSGSVSAAGLNLSGEIRASGRTIVGGGAALRSTFGRRRTGGGPLALRSSFHNLDVNGEVHCNKITVGTGKGFKIDHPLDPENKHLYHWCVESPDVMNIYNGNVMTGANGQATVELPSYFQALNDDFRYQLTVIGKPALATIETEIENNIFTIRTDQPNVKVSWQVTGTRHDPAILANRLPVEEEKPAAERGFAEYPEPWETADDSVVSFHDCEEMAGVGPRKQEPAVVAKRAGIAHALISGECAETQNRMSARTRLSS